MIQSNLESKGHITMADEMNDDMTAAAPAGDEEKKEEGAAEGSEDTAE